MNIALFKIELKRGLNALLPFARENTMNFGLWMEEYKANGGQTRSERVHLFEPYRLLLTIENVPGKDTQIIMGSVSARGRLLSNEEKEAVCETFSEVFPDLESQRIDGSLLPNATAFKVFGISKQTVP